MKLSTEKYFGLGHVPVGIGAVLKGWDIKEDDFHRPDALQVVDFRAMTGACSHNCFHCFTNKSKKTLTLDEIKDVIDQAAGMNARTIDYLGEGEPTLDSDFFEIIEYTAREGIRPVIFTDAATRMRDRDFVKRVKDSGASVSPKCDSLWNPEYQNWVVGDKTGQYFNQRQEALDILIDEGFNEVQPDGTTRLGFDMVISKRNMGEVERTLRFCRNNNLWVIFAFYLPAGRSGSESFDRSLMLSEEEKKALRETVQRIDKEYGHEHPIYNNFATGPCVELIQIYGNGDVSPCPGNETVMGNVKSHKLIDLHRRILEKFPWHDRKTFDGHCLYRSKI